MKNIKFTRPAVTLGQIRNAGETHEFADKHANHLVAQGYGTEEQAEGGKRKAETPAPIS